MYHYNMIKTTVTWKCLALYKYYISISSHTPLHQWRCKIINITSTYWFISPNILHASCGNFYLGPYDLFLSWAPSTSQWPCTHCSSVTMLSSWCLYLCPMCYFSHIVKHPQACLYFNILCDTSIENIFIIWQWIMNIN